LIPNTELLAGTIEIVQAVLPMEILDN